MKNKLKVVLFYHWFLIKNDVDDNKFVDCAVATNADCIVTNDRHFDVVKEVRFPVITVINLGQFQMLLSQQV